MKPRFLVAIMCVLLLCSMSLAQMQRPHTQANAGVIPAGTQLDVRMIDNLSSETAKAGDTFRGTLQSAIVVNGATIFPKDAEVTGTVVSAKHSGRLSEPGELELAITRVQYGSVGADLSVEPILMKGESHAKSNATKIGGGAAVGALIGAIAGGGKGAAIGATVGAAAGTGVAAATGKKESKVESEAVLSWRTSADARATNGTARGPRWPSSDPVKDYDDDRNSAPIGAAPEFSARDRRVIKGCLSDSAQGLPPGLAKKDRLPPGLEKQVQRNGTLPPGLQKRVQPLPIRCEQQLGRLPSAIERVILNRRILMIDAQNRILDLFSLDD